MFAVSEQVILSGVCRRTMPGMPPHPEGDYSFDLVKEDEGVVVGLPYAPRRRGSRTITCSEISNSGTQFGPYRARELWAPTGDFSFASPAGELLVSNRGLFMAKNTVIATMNSVCRMSLARLATKSDPTARTEWALTLMDALWFHESLATESPETVRVNPASARDMIAQLVRGNPRASQEARSLLSRVALRIMGLPWPDRPDIPSINALMQSVYRETRLPPQGGRILLRED